MSKYTTEVRFICEQYAGLTDSVGYDEIDNVISAVLNNEDPKKRIFEEYPIFDEAYRNVLNTRILKHYYTREICAETVGLWKLWLNNKMREIMPKYNKLYKSELLEFNPFYDTDLSRSHTKDGSSEATEEHEASDNKSSNRVYDENIDNSNSNTATATNEANKEYSGNSDSANSSTENSEMDKGHTDKYSDTPQGSLSGVDTGNYLTNYRKIDEGATGHTENTSSGTVNETNKETSMSNNTQSNVAQGNEKRSGNNSESSLSNSKHKNTNNITNAETYLEHIKGKQGTTSYSKMLLEYRDTFLNIDQMIINELNSLFFGLWE